MNKLKEWFKAAGVRAIKTAAQTAVATMPVTAITIGDVDWAIVASSAVLAGIISLLTSVAGIPEVDNGESVPEIVKEGKHAN